MSNAEQILDFNIVSHSVEHIKKIYDHGEKDIPKKFTAALAWQSRAGGTGDLLQKYSETMTNAFSAIKHCPFQETVPISLQTALTISQKILESFEGMDKKDLTQEKIVTTVTEGLMKIYDTNLSKFDGLALKTCLLFFMFITLESEHSTKLVIMLEELFDRSLDNLVLYGNQMRGISNASGSAVAKSMVKMLACLTSDFDHFEVNAEK